MEEMGRAASLQPYVTIVYIGRIHHHSEALLVSIHHHSEALLVSIHHHSEALLVSIHHHSEALLVSQHVLEMTDGDGTKGAVI